MPLTEDQQAEIDELRSTPRPTLRAVSEGMEAHLYKAYPVLDHGHVRVIDYMGDDAAIVQAARYGLQLEGTTIYCSMEPCRVCAMLIASSGVSRVVARRRYHAGGDTPEILGAAGVELVIVEDIIESYEGQ